MGSLLWDIFLSRKKGSISESCSKQVGSISTSECWKKEFKFYESCWRKGFNSLGHVEKKQIQSFEAYSMGRIQKGFNSLTHFSKNQKPILWVIWKKGSILWVTLKRRVPFCESYKKRWFNSLSHIFSKRFNSWSHFLLRVQCLEFFFWKNYILCITFKKKFNSLCHVQQKKKIQFLWVISKKKFSS